MIIIIFLILIFLIGFPCYLYMQENREFLVEKFLLKVSKYHIFQYPYYHEDINTQYIAICVYSNPHRSKIRLDTQSIDSSDIEIFKQDKKYIGILHIKHPTVHRYEDPKTYFDTYMFDN